MKANLIFLISLGVNLLLVGGIVRHTVTSKPGATDTVSSAITPVVTNTTAASAVPVTNVVTEAGKPFHWRQLESEDYHRYTANLRAIGCPEPTVQDILYNDVYKAYAAKIRDLHKTYRIDRRGQNTDYWKPIAANHETMAARTRAIMRINLEKHRLLYSLLGVDMERTKLLQYGLPDVEGARLPFLAADKLRQAQEITSRFADLEYTLRYKYAEYDGPERGQEVLALGKERDSELLKVMTASELEEYMLRMSPMAARVRYRLQDFEPSEQEFRAFYKFEEKYYQPYVEQIDRDDPVAQKKADEEASRRLGEQQRMLGEARFTEYRRSQQSEYRDLNRLAQQNNLPKQTAAKVYDMQMAAERQLYKLQQETSLNEEQREQAVLQIRELTQKSVKGVVGEKVYEQYKNTGGGYWLERLGKPGTPRSDPQLLFR
jgi:hypothetical protein